MPRKAVENKDNIEQKLEYLGLDLENIPKQLKQFKSIDFKLSKFNDEKQYKQYRYVPIKDIQILLSPTNRLDEIELKYKKASPLYEYLDSSNENNILKYTTFLNMLKQFDIKEVEKIQEEQVKLNRKIPFKVKFESNYLWQIYYSEETNIYFMIVPIEDSNYSTFFYLLKKKIEDNKTEKIYVPIRNIEYSNNYLKKSQFEDIENYLWLFTKDWPLIYEVYDKKNNLSIRIIGETEVYEKIKSSYRIKLDTKEETVKFYKLLKAMFILETELPNYFKFRTDISKNGGIEFFAENKNITYEEIPKWINQEYEKGIERIKVAEELIEKNNEKLKNLKIEIASQDIEYLAKEKQISTFLECKKSFFGKFKYYFKYGKKSNKNQKKIIEPQNENIESKTNKKEIKKREHKSNYTIEELVELYKEFEEKETILKKLFMDINSLKLKKKNMQKKIENASNFIAEIDSHKKSIFEFWRYSNKDEMSSLPEGEEEEVNIIKKITKVFDYEEDLEKFGKTMDKIQRKELSKEELDSIYISSTNLIKLLNKVKSNEVSPREITANLRELKKEAVDEKLLSEDEFDIFGGMSKENTKISGLKDKKHRETPKDKFTILEINQNSKALGYKLTLEKVIENIKKALKKITITEDLPVYIAKNDEKLEVKDINIFELNPETEIQRAIKIGKGKISFYKINLKKGTHAISYTNSIFYDNTNKTLPIGQDISTKILVDTQKLKLKPKQKSNFKIINYENEKDDFSKITLKAITVYEYDIL